MLLLSVSLISFSQEKTVEKLSTAPNPFENSTQITFTSSLDAAVLLTVTNVLGRTVFKNTYKTKKGKNSIPFYKHNLATGMYIYSIRNSNSTISKRFVIK